MFKSVGIPQVEILILCQFQTRDIDFDYWNVVKK